MRSPRATAREELLLAAAREKPLSNKDLARPNIKLVNNKINNCACVLRRFSRVQLCVTPWTAARQAPPSMGFSMQEYWSELLCPSPGDLKIMLKKTGEQKP